MAITYSKGSLYAADPDSKLVLYILQSGFCNIKCRHCYMQFQKEAVKRRNLNVAKRDIQNLLSQGYRVHLRGTEIMLNPEYLSLFPLAGQAYLQTNGALLHLNQSFFLKLKDAGLHTIILTYPIDPEGIVDMSERVIQDVIGTGSVEGFRIVVNIIITKSIITPNPKR